PDFSGDLWMKGADAIEDIQASPGELTPAKGKAGAVVWIVRSPYVLVGGRLEVEASGAKFFLSWDGKSWTEAGPDLDKLFPPDGGEAEGTDVVFGWLPGRDPDGERIADYHFELSDRPDMKWPLSTNFYKLIANTPDRGREQYTLPHGGLLASGQTYYWRVR